MPALTVWGHPISLLAGDDLRKIAVLAVLLRSIQIACLIPSCIDLLETGRSFDMDNASDSCKEKRIKSRNILWAFWTVSASTVFFSLMLELCLFRVSSRGSPVATEERQALSWLCGLKLIPLTALRIAALCLGLASLTILRQFCLPTSEFATECFPVAPVQDQEVTRWCPEGSITMLSIVAVSHMLEVATIGLILLRLFCQKTSPFRRVLVYLRNWNILSTGSRDASWQCCCRACCGITSLLTCCICGGRQAVSKSNNLSDISVVLADYFDTGGHDIDVTPSDLLVGIHVLSLEQQRDRQKLVLKLSKEEELQSFHDVERGCIVHGKSIVAGSFGFNESVKEESESLSFTDSPPIHRRRSSIRQPQLRRADTGSMAHYSMTERPTLHTRNKVDAQAIMEGARYSKLALAIYGHLMYLLQDKYCTAPCTLTAASVVRCVSKPTSNEYGVLGDNVCGCNSAAFDLFADQEDGIKVLFSNFTVGIGKCPYAVVVDKAKQTIVIVIRGTLSLEDVVTDLSLQPVLISEHGEECEGFRNLSGHCHRGFLDSTLWIYRDLKERKLLETLLLSDSAPYRGYRLVITGHSLGAGCAAILAVILRPRFEQLQCLCFEPPGCVFSKKLAQQDYIRTYVVDSDIVPRLSLHSVEGLRNDVLETIARIRVPKYKAMGSRECNGVLYDPDQIPDTAFYRQIQAFRKHQRDLSERRSDKKLYIPGRRVVYLVPKSTGVSGSFFDVSGLWTDQQYTPVWASTEHFREIQLRRTIISDHDPLHLSNILNHLAKSFNGSMEENSTRSGPGFEEFTTRGTEQ